MFTSSAYTIYNYYLFTYNVCILNIKGFGGGAFEQFHSVNYLVSLFVCRYIFNFRSSREDNYFYEKTN